MAVEAAVEANTEEVTKEVEQRMAKLTQNLLEQNRLADLKRMTVDDAFRKSLLEELCL